MKILVMGLPGSGKTTFSQALLAHFPNAVHLNGDRMREQYNDWDFSVTGRIRQAQRMTDAAADLPVAIIDFVCPLEKMRKTVDADWVVWIDTIEQGRFEDTNRLFEPPVAYDFRVTEQNATVTAAKVAEHIKSGSRRPVFDPKKPTVQMLGRWQPWHAGHRALFERAVAKTGQVCIMVRDCQHWNDSNPFDAEQVIARIHKDLEFEYQGQYTVQLVPNIVNITYGRDVGYVIEQEVFDEQTHAISATKIRKQMGL